MLLDVHCNKKVELAAEIAVGVAALVLTAVTAGGSVWLQISSAARWAVVFRAGASVPGVLSSAAL